MIKGDKWDPKGLITEAYRIEGISDPECRSIFLDWALSLDAAVDQREALATLVARAPVADHPMTVVLKEGLQPLSRPQGRRGGARARARH